jgi:CcmD family protein
MQMEHFGYLLAAYSLIFGGIFLYVVFIWRRQVALDEELRALEAQMQSLKSAGAQPETSTAQPEK